MYVKWSKLLIFYYIARLLKILNGGLLWKVEHIL